MKSICAIIFAFNEMDTLQQAYDELREACKSTGALFTIIIIDDGSTDSTPSIADSLAAEHTDTRVVHHGVNQGMGGVYRTAFREADGDVVYFMAADLQPIPKLYFETMYPQLDEYDIVIGVEPKRDVPFLSKFLSDGERLLFRLLHPRVPKIGGPMMIKKQVIDSTDLVFRNQKQDRSWIVLWELVICAERNDARIRTVETHRRSRAKGHSKGSTLKNASLMLRRLFDLERALWLGK